MSTDGSESVVGGREELETVVGRGGGGGTISCINSRSVNVISKKQIGNKQNVVKNGGALNKKHTDDYHGISCPRAGISSRQR